VFYESYKLFLLEYKSWKVVFKSVML